MVGGYTGLPADVAATVPRRSLLRESWVRRPPSPAPSVPIPPTNPDKPPIPPTPTLPNPQMKLGVGGVGGEVGVVVGQYQPRTPPQELVSGQVSRTRAFFESDPLLPPTPPLPPESEEEVGTAVTLVVVRRENPRPRPHYYRNTISAFPRWATGEEEVGGGEGPIVWSSPHLDALGDLLSPPPAPITPIQIRRVRPVVTRRRYGTVVGVGGGGRGGAGAGGGGWAGDGGGPVGSTGQAATSDTSARRSPHPPHCYCHHTVGGECANAALGGQCRGDTMLVGGVVAPGGVTASIKSFKDIPPHLLECLQESSVDPPTPSTPSQPSPPTPAPRTEWREGGSDGEGGEGGTSDYHTSDGRGSSLSGASDDHHNYHNHDGVDEEAYSLATRGLHHLPPSGHIQSSFRGFCTTMLDAPVPPPPRPVPPPRPNLPPIPPPRPPARPPPPEEFRSRSPSPEIDRRRKLEEELRAAGVYFRRPGSPPRVPIKPYVSPRALFTPPRTSSPSRTLFSTPRTHHSTSRSTSLDNRHTKQTDTRYHDAERSLQTSRSFSPDRSEVSRSFSPSRTRQTTRRDSEAVAAALEVLEASLAGMTDSSSDNSPARSHASSVVERRQSGSDLTHATLTPRGSRDADRVGEGIVGGIPSQEVPLDSHQAAMESLNLIEEVYVQARSVPQSSVSMNAYYPGQYSTSFRASSRYSPTPSQDSQDNPTSTPGHHHPPLHTPSHATLQYDSTPSSSPRTPLTPSHVEEYPPPPVKYPPTPSQALTVSRDPTSAPDSDSGHESGATSPCDTLTAHETPPASPQTSHTHTQGPAAHDPTSTPTLDPHTHHDHSRTSSLLSCRGVGVLEGEVGVAVVGEPDTVGGMGVDGRSRGGVLEPRPPSHFVVVAIDFGTTFSGYAFSFTRDPDSVHMMKKWEGGDPGVQNQKTPTIVLLTPEGEFHSLGYTARDTYHDLDPHEARKWLYFDKFKMTLHADQSLNRDTLLQAANGVRVPALQIFTHALAYFRAHALRELSDQAGVAVVEEDVRWVITVPAIWSHPAKQFMRTAAYKAGMGSPTRPEQLLIALEPEAAAIYCRRLRRHQLLPERPLEPRPPLRSPTAIATSIIQPPPMPALPELDREELISLPYRSLETVADWLREDTVYAVVDCGGGTVDITVHQMTDRATGHLKELHKATGGPHGSTGVDAEFEKFLETIFGADFLTAFKQQRPAAYVDLMIAFESRKRNASPYRSNPLNIALPFSFIDLYRKFKGKDVEWAIKRQERLGVRWSAQGMLRVEQEAMRQLFLPTLSNITQAIELVLSAPEVGRLQYMFLVGGFAESELLQKHIRDIFGHRVNVIIPQGMGLAILRGAVQFGLDPGVVTVRRSRLTYGIGVLNRYQPDLHPSDKRVVAAGAEWCADVLDRFVVVDESVAVGDVVVRSYTPATPSQTTVILHLYATQRHNAKFVTEEGVERVGTLHLDLGPATKSSINNNTRREITVHMKFGDTEVKASAVDHHSGQCVKANIDFLTL